MQSKFIIKTPFGIGVATSEEDLKDMLSFVEGISGEGAERSEAQQEEEACDCENCQHNARASEEKLAELTELLASIDDLDILRFMEKDAVIHMNAAAIGLGEDHPQVAHIEKVISHVQERIAELGNEDASPKAQLSEEQLLERLSDNIDHINKISDLTVLHYFREFMTTVLESDDPNKKREAELLIGKIDERLTELTGESDADKVDNKTIWGKRNPELLGTDYVSTTVDIGADMLASIDLGYEITSTQMVNLISRSTEILDEYLKEQVEKMNAPEAPAEDSPDEEPLPTLEEIKAMTDYDELDKLQIGLQAEQWRLSDKKQVIINEIHSEMSHVEDLHAAATERKGAILNNKADIARADIAESLKALQEAITRGGEHLLIHEDIHEAMEILRERYSKQ